WLTIPLSGWRGRREVWSREKVSRACGMMASFTPPPPPPLGPKYGGLWNAETIRLAGTVTGRYVLLNEPYYGESLLEPPPVGDALNSLARTLISDWLVYAPPFTVLPQPSLLARLLAPPRTDPPPLGRPAQPLAPPAF